MGKTFQSVSSGKETLVSPQVSRSLASLWLESQRLVLLELLRWTMENPMALHALVGAVGEEVEPCARLLGLDRAAYRGV